MWKRFAKETLKETSTAVGGTALAYGIYQAGSMSYATGKTFFCSQIMTTPKPKPEEKASIGINY